MKRSNRGFKPAPPAECARVDAFAFYEEKRETGEKNFALHECQNAIRNEKAAPGTAGAAFRY